MSCPRFLSTRWRYMTGSIPSRSGGLHLRTRDADAKANVDAVYQIVALWIA